MKATEVPLRGTVIGFEEYEHYVLRAAPRTSSPFRILSSVQAPISFVVVNPFLVLDDYSFEIDDAVVKALCLQDDAMQNVATLCIARIEDKKFFANFRSPLIINTKEGRFQQIILPNENYGVSVMIAASAEGD